MSTSERPAARRQASHPDQRGRKHRRAADAAHEPPAPPSAEPLVLLSRAGVRRLGEGHPWLFPDLIAQGSLVDGALVRLEGPAGRLRGMAVHSVGSRIPLRVVSRQVEGEFAADWWVQRVDQAIARREQDLAPGEQACRWVHSEADGLPGLVVDRYGDVAVLQAGCRWADGIAPALARHLVARHGLRGVLARHDGPFRRLEGLREEVKLLAGDVPESVPWLHGGLQRHIDPWHGQKTGGYLDQRENQLWAPGVLPRGRVLDAFCHDGGFGLHLAAAGSLVEALDSSQPALERVAAHAAANGLSARLVPRQVNVFENLRARVAAGDQFDAIVLDPPALSKRREDLRAALRAYKELNLRALRLLRHGGRLLTCSCSFHVGREDFLDVLRAAAADAQVPAVLRELRGAAACHPRLLTFPESDYLKVLLVEVPPAGGAPPSSSSL